MWGWVGELASAFASGGMAGLVLLSLLIIIITLLRQISKHDEEMTKMHQSTIAGLEHSSNSHLAVAKVLSRMEAILRLPIEDDEHGPA